MSNNNQQNVTKDYNHSDIQQPMLVNYLKFAYIILKIKYENVVQKYNQNRDSSLTDSCTTITLEPILGSHNSD